MAISQLVKSKQENHHLVHRNNLMLTNFKLFNEPSFVNVLLSNELEVPNSCSSDTENPLYVLVMVLTQ